MKRSRSPGQIEIDVQGIGIMLVAVLISFVLMTACDASYAEDISPAKARAIAEEAYLYGIPLVMNYKAMYLNAVWKESPDFKAPFNHIKNISRVSTPEDKAIVAPNSDTPYSWAYLDLRSEPIVLSIPKIEKKRYFSVQLIDAYTHNFAYLGTRTTGNIPGNYLIANLRWTGKKPRGISRIIRSETSFVLALFRTQLFGVSDLENVQKIQAGYKVKPLSEFLGISAPTKAPDLAFPVWDAKKAQGLDFFVYLDFMLQQCPVHPSERDLRKRFASINVGGKSPFDSSSLSPDMKEALMAGLAEMQEAIKRKMDADRPFFDATMASLDTFGSRKQLEAAASRWNLKNFYFLRAVGAILGIYGNSGEEAIYPVYMVDANNDALDGTKHRYQIHLPAGKPLPAKAFWSLTMYDGISILLVPNPINRYLINSAMLPTLKRDADGGLTLYIQHDSPGKDKESNWLPAPEGPFQVDMRLYLPDPKVLNHQWKLPPMVRVD